MLLYHKSKLLVYFSDVFWYGAYVLMNLYNPKNIEEKVIKLLSKGEKLTTTLLDETNKIGKKISKQGFYKALRKLKKEEVLLVYSKIASLDVVWIRNQSKVINDAMENYSLNPETQSVFDIENGESATYTFSKIKNLDTFWGHIQSALIKITPKNEPIFSYDPHYWFYIAREQREKVLLEEMVEQKRQFLMTVGGKTEIDKSIKKHFNNDYLQYNHNKLFDKSNFYMTLVGEYIIEVNLDKFLSEKVDEIFIKNFSTNDSIKKEFEEILESKGKNKIKISRNINKSAKLKSKFKKDFYIIKNRP